jgi:uncharacterized protein YoxC
MRKFWDLVVISFLVVSIMLSLVLEVMYSKELSKKIDYLNKKVDALLDENKKLTYELEKLTSLENLVGKDLTKYKVSFNRVIVVNQN